jgi:CspA family cold shock protein
MVSRSARGTSDGAGAAAHVIEATERTVPKVESIATSRAHAAVDAASFSSGTDSCTRPWEVEDIEMPNGTVKRVQSDRGFGFITGEDGNEYFFHRTGLDSSLDFDALRGGEQVTFDVQQGDKGPRAAKVRAAN